MHHLSVLNLRRKLQFNYLKVALLRGTYLPFILLWKSVNLQSQNFPSQEKLTAFSNF